MPKLTQDQARYIMKLWEDLREANRMTRKFDWQWNRLNDEMNHYLERSGEKDIVQRNKIKAANISLSDAYAAGSWWREKAMWLSTAILAEKAAKEMLEGGVGWES